MRPLLNGARGWRAVARLLSDMFRLPWQLVCEEATHWHITRTP